MFWQLLILNQFNKNSNINNNLNIQNTTPTTTSQAELLKPNIIFDIESISDNTSCSYLYSKLKDDKSYFIFNPNSHFGNSILLYKSLKKKLNEKYFGTSKKPLNPFEKCKTTKEIYHLSRNIKVSLSSKLSKVGYVLYKNGDVNINHKDSSILQNNLNIRTIILDFIKNHEENIKIYTSANDKFNKYDYFIPTKLYEGIISANSYIQKGIPIKVLGERKIYPMYGVFSPTRQDYLEFSSMSIP